MFCFECGFKLIEGSKFCSSCGTAQIKQQNFQVELTFFTESWLQEFEASEDQEVWASECVFRSNDETSVYLTFAEDSKQSLLETALANTRVDFSEGEAPRIGDGIDYLCQLASNFRGEFWEFELRFELKVTLTVSATSEAAARKYCEEHIQQLLGLWHTTDNEVSPIGEFLIEDILDEAAIAEKKATWAAALAKGRQ